MNTTRTKLPYGHPSTLRPGEFFPCRGSAYNAINPENRGLTPTQTAWMKANKPLYYTGRAIEDLPHLPPHLRFDA
jgi:hypothetical protein